MKRPILVVPVSLAIALIGSCASEDDGTVTQVPVGQGTGSTDPSGSTMPTGPATGPNPTVGPNPTPTGPNPVDGTGGAPPVAPTTICGNGVVNVGETCDDGNMTPGDGCENDCTRTPPAMAPVAECGNMMVEGGEQCDDGNMTAGDGCEPDCTTTPPAACGNSTVDEGEECDDGNMTPGDGCENNCTETVEIECGNSITEAGEECDDGNMTADDGCEPDCTMTPEPPPVICGDGMVGEGEACDDGNAENGDGCEDDCTMTPEPTGPPTIQELVPDLDGWLITTPCGDEPSSDDCAGGGFSINGGPLTACEGGTRLNAVLTYDVGGEPGVEYDVEMHFYGVMEPRQYGNQVEREAGGSGASRDEGGTPTPFATGGANPNIGAGDQNYNTYELHVLNENDEEVRSYFFNSEPGTGHYTLAISYAKTLRLVGGGSVRIRVVDNNCRMIKNCGANGGAPCSAKARSIDISAADPQPAALQQPGLGKAAEHSGQWWLIDVLNVSFVE